MASLISLGSLPCSQAFESARNAFVMLRTARLNLMPVGGALTVALPPAKMGQLVSWFFKWSQSQASGAQVRFISLFCFHFKWTRWLTR